jgi:hypothetical protein
LWPDKNTFDKKSFEALKCISRKKICYPDKNTNIVQRQGTMPLTFVCTGTISSLNFPEAVAAAALA